LVVKNAFGKLDGRVLVELNVAIDYRSALLMDVFAEEEEGGRGEMIVAVS